jgi:hypothetical protein
MPAVIVSVVLGPSLNSKAKTPGPCKFKPAAEVSIVT